MRDEIPLAKETMSKRGIIGSQPRGNHNVFTHYPKDLDCEICWKNKHNTSQVQDKSKDARGWDCTFYKMPET